MKQMLKDELSVKGAAILCLEAVGLVGLMALTGLTLFLIGNLPFNTVG